MPDRFEVMKSVGFPYEPGQILTREEIEQIKEQVDISSMNDEDDCWMAEGSNRLLF